MTPVLVSWGFPLICGRHFRTIAIHERRPASDRRDFERYIDDHLYDPQGLLYSYFRLEDHIVLPGEMALSARGVGMKLTESYRNYWLLRRES